MNPKFGKTLKILIVPELLLAIYVIVFWVFPFMLNTAVSMSGF